jgi:hypothetical protein
LKMNQKGREKKSDVIIFFLHINEIYIYIYIHSFD